MKIQWKQVSIALITGLLLGTAVGALGLRYRTHEFALRRQVQYFGRKLDLTPAQKEQVTQILENKRDKIRALSQEMRPRFQEVRKDTREEIRKILTPDQQKKFDAMREKPNQPRNPFF